MFLLNKIGLLLAIFIVTNSCSANDNSSLSDACVINEFKIDRLLYSSETDCKYLVSLSDLKSILSIVDKYWSWNVTNDKRYQFLSDEYKSILKNQFGVNSGSEYKVPESSYERFWVGLNLP